MNKGRLIAIMAIGMTMSLSAQQRMYFDENWEVTTKDKMVYYRETEKKGQHTLIKDYYKNGVIQMEGTAIDATPNREVFDGKVVWNYENGKPQTVSEYVKGALTGTNTSYDSHGRVTSEFNYKSEGNFEGRMTTYKTPEEGILYNGVDEYKDGNLVYSLIYDESKTGIRQEIFYKTDGSNSVKSYNAKGKLIGQYSSTPSVTTSGVLATYYYNPMAVMQVDKYSNKGELEENKTYDRKGQLLQEAKYGKKEGKAITYKDGVKVGEMLYKAEDGYGYVSPYHGKEYSFDFEKNYVTSISEYDKGAQTLYQTFYPNGKLEQTTTYNDSLTDKVVYYKDDGSKNGEIVYQEGVPYEGTEISDWSETTYSKGIVQKSISKYAAGNVLQEKIYNAAKDQYNGKVYTSDGKVKYSYTMNQNEDNGFTGEISEYKNGKVVNKGVVKDGVLESGIIRVDSDNGSVSYERKNNWIITRKTNSEGKQYFENKVLVDGSDDSLLNLPSFGEYLLLEQTSSSFY